MYLSEPLAEEVIKALEELIISAENLINSDEKYKKRCFRYSIPQRSGKLQSS